MCAAVAGERILQMNRIRTTWLYSEPRFLFCYFSSVSFSIGSPLFIFVCRMSKVLYGCCCCALHDATVCAAQINQHDNSRMRPKMEKKNNENRKQLEAELFCRWKWIGPVDDVYLVRMYNLLFSRSLIRSFREEKKNAATHILPFRIAKIRNVRAHLFIHFRATRQNTAARWNKKAKRNETTVNFSSLMDGMAFPSVR